MSTNIVFTIGHSTRSIEDFLALLTENAIEQIADVRRFPGSRRHPQFGQDEFSKSLADAHIGYTHFLALGGRRSSPSEAKHNSPWRVAAFAAYADYMQTPEFTAAFGDLEVFAAAKRTAIMCAEAGPWRCHRRLIADQFIAVGWQVLDIVGPHNTKPHELPPFAKIANAQVTYPGNPTLFD